MPSTNYKYLYNKYKNKYIRLLAHRGGMNRGEEGGADAVDEVSQEILNLNSNGIQILQYCLNEGDYRQPGIIRVPGDQHRVDTLLKNAKESENISPELYQNTPGDDDEDKEIRAHLRMSIIKRIFRLFLDNNLILYNLGEFSKNPNPNIDISEFFDLFFVFVWKTTLYTISSRMTSNAIASVMYMWLSPQNQDELGIHMATNIPLIEEFINRKNYMLTHERIISLESHHLMFLDTHKEYTTLHSELETYKKLKNDSLLSLKKIEENHPGLVKCLKIKNEAMCNDNKNAPCKWDIDNTCIIPTQTWTEFFTLSNRENNIDPNVLVESKAHTLILRNMDDNILSAEANLRRIIDNINEYDGTY